MSSVKFCFNKVTRETPATLLKQGSDESIFLDSFRFFQRSHSVEHLRMFASDIEMLSWSLIEKRNLIF